MVRYYSTQRPPDIGTFPKPRENKVLEIHTFEERTEVKEIGRAAWGYIDYESLLSERDTAAYELTPGKKANDMKLLNDFQRLSMEIQEEFLKRPEDFRKEHRIEQRLAGLRNEILARMGN